MTVSTVATQWSYAANGVTTSFPYNNKISSGDDLIVGVVDTSGNYVGKTNGVDYTVTNVGVDAGGNVVFVVAPSTGTVDIRTFTPQTQLTSIKNQGSFLPELHEDAFDKLDRALQDIYRRCYTYGIHGPDTESTGWPALPSPATRAGKALMFDAVTGLPALGVPNTQTITAGLLAPFFHQDRTPAEIAAFVFPTDTGYAPGWVQRYGAVGDGVTDDAAAFATAALVSDKHPMTIYPTTNGYLCNTHFQLPAGGTMLGVGRPTIKTTVAGMDIVYAANVANVTIQGIIFKGAGSATTPTNNVTGAATSTALVTLSNCTDVRVWSCEFWNFYNGLTTYKCTRLWVNFNRVRNWLVYGILGSLCSEASCDFNDVHGCDQVGAANCYGIMVTGDQNGGNPSKGVSISFNRIWDVPSWDGIMSHDCDGLTIVGNDIRNVRNGLDVTYTGVTHLYLKNLTIANNYLECTTVNNGWAPASSVAIYLAGSASFQIDTATITGNTCRGWGNIVSGSLDANQGVIFIGYVNVATLSGNIIEGTGVVNGAAYAGVYASGTIGTLSIMGGSIRGSHPSGAVRLASATVTELATGGICIDQTTNSNPAISISSSTVSSYARGQNATNSTVPFTQSGSTVTFAANDSMGSFTCNAAATVVVNDPNVTAASKIVLQPTNASAATLQGSAKCLYISAKAAGTSFTVATANAVACAGTETFDYRICY